MNSNVVNKVRGDVLEQMGADGSFADHVDKYQTFDLAWQDCNNPSWMIWLLTKTEPKKKLIATLCLIAERTLSYTSDDRPKLAIEIIKKWTKGKATIENVLNAQLTVKQCYKSIIYKTFWKREEAEIFGIRDGFIAAKQCCNAVSHIIDAIVCKDKEETLNSYKSALIAVAYAYAKDAVNERYNITNILREQHDVPVFADI